MILQSIIIVTNDASLGRDLQSALGNAASDHSADVFDNAKTALDAIAHKKQVGLLLLDWDFLTPKGVAHFLQSFRKIRRAQPIPLMLVTDDPSPSIVAMAMEYDALQLLMRSGFKVHVKHALTEFLSRGKQSDVFQSLVDDLEVSLASKNAKAIDEAVESLYRRFPKNPRAQVEYGNNLIRRKQYVEAENIALELLRESANNVRAMGLLARARLHLKKFDEAIALMEQCEVLSPDCLDRLVLFGEIYWSKGSHGEAKEKYQAALAIDAENLDAKKGLAAVAVSVGEEAEALSLLGSSLSSDEIAAFFNNAGILASRRGRYEEAIRLYESVIKTLEDPSQRAKVLFNMGLAYERLGLEKDSQRVFAQASELDPEFKKARLHLETLGETD